MILDARDKLVSHLCRHKGIGDLLFIKIVVQGNQVETQLFRNDIYRGATGEGGIHVIHIGVEAIAGVCCHLVACLQVEVTVIPMDKGH